MNTQNTSGALRGVGVGALMLGVVGAATFWWVPMGLVLSLAGLVVGIADCVMAGRRSLDRRLSFVAIVVSLAALALDATIAGLGWQTWTFGGY